jgi:hypothetical protein
MTPVSKVKKAFESNFLVNNVFLSFFLDFSKNFTFPWDYHGGFYWGYSLVLRCLPGYQIPKSFGSVRRVLTAKNNITSFI